MRALFIQLSLLVAIMTTYSMRSGDASTWTALFWGALIGCSICFILLLGDLAVHKLLEDRDRELHSARFLGGEPDVSLDDIARNASLADGKEREAA